jgi:Asp/Glu/hydantoin racemase
VIATPILKIDDPMAARAVELGPRVGILCTTPSTQGPSTELVREHAQRAQRAVTPESRLVAGAFDALSAGDRGTHDRLIGEAAAELASRNDVLVLAQASMAHLAQPLQAALPVPVLCSPPLAIEALVRHYGPR